MTAKPSRLLVVDAHAMAYRAYYALQGQNLHHPVTGMPTHAIYGFFRMFFPLLLEYEPQSCIIAWDSSAPVFRTKRYPKYKATRKPMPDDLRSQIEEIKALLSENDFCSIEAPGFEADDIIGTLAKRFSKLENEQVYLVTNDKDCYQLLSKNVMMLKSSKGTKDITVIDSDWVESEIGIQVKQVTDYMGLVGDTSDNIPGVQGIGPKSALTLLQNHNSLKGIYENLDSLRSKKVQKKLKENKKEAFLSQELAVIKTDVKEALSLDKKKAETPSFLADKTLRSFQEQGYNQIFLELKKAQKEKGSRIENTAGPINTELEKTELGKEKKAEEKIKEKVSYTLITDIEQLKKILKILRKQMGEKKFLALDTETNSINTMEARLIGISLCVKKKEAFYISLPSSQTLFHKKGILWDEAYPLLKEFLEDKNLCIIGQNLKYDYAVLKRHGLVLPPPYFDTMLASYLCSPSLRRHNLDDMAQDLLGYQTITYEEITGKGAKKKNIEEIEPEIVNDYACEDADISLRLYEVLQNKIKKNGLESVYREIEMPLLPVLMRMEEEGMGIDKKYFADLSIQYTKKLEGLKEEIYSLAGCSFNIHSTRELQKILFEDLNLPKGRKTKTGYSTDQEVLEKLQGMHPLVDSILEHRKYSKLHSTYVEALPRLIHPQTQRIHTSFNQTIAATGRLSSVNPNLQNIPIRENTGRAIRRGFIPRADYILVSMDYSQVELRIMAHYAEDKALIEVFSQEGSDIEGSDIHTKTAASLFGVSEEEVTADMRAHAKTVNFSIIYGVTEFGLSKSLNVDRATAAEYIQRFFTRYPGVRSYMDKITAFAEENGWVQTLSGRIRPIPSIKDSNHFRREGARRMAVNTPIQGTSADIIKAAMIDIDRDIRQKKWKSRMILQVHDELIFDVHPKEEEELVQLARRRMENAMPLKVPLRVETGRGKNWEEAH